MATQTEPRTSGFFNSVAGQLTLLGIVTVVLLVVAWRYVW